MQICLQFYLYKKDDTLFWNLNPTWAFCKYCGAFLSPFHCYSWGIGDLWNTEGVRRPAAGERNLGQSPSQQPMESLYRIQLPNWGKHISKLLVGILIIYLILVNTRGSSPAKVVLLVSYSNTI